MLDERGICSATWTSGSVAAGCSKKSQQEAYLWTYRPFNISLAVMMDWEAVRNLYVCCSGVWEVIQKNPSQFESFVSTLWARLDSLWIRIELSSYQTSATLDMKPSGYDVQREIAVHGDRVVMVMVDSNENTIAKWFKYMALYYRPMLTAAYLGTLTINPTTTVITYIHTSTYLIYLLTYLPTSLHTYLFIHAYLHTYFPNNIPDPSTFVIIIIIIYQPTSLTNLLTTTYNRYFL